MAMLFKAPQPIDSLPSTKYGVSHTHYCTEYSVLRTDYGVFRNAVHTIISAVDLRGWPRWRRNSPGLSAANFGLVLHGRGSGTNRDILTRYLPNSATCQSASR